MVSAEALAELHEPRASARFVAANVSDTARPVVHAALTDAWVRSLPDRRLADAFAALLAAADPVTLTALAAHLGVTDPDRDRFRTLAGAVHTDAPADEQRTMLALLSRAHMRLVHETGGGELMVDAICGLISPPDAAALTRTLLSVWIADRHAGRN